MFVLVRKVVEEIERKVMSKFGEHWRSPAAPPLKNVFGGEKCEEFNGISFRIFGGVLDRFKNC